MAIIYNEIEIQAPIAEIWEALTDVERLEQYDPTVKKSTALSTFKKGIGAKRKVEMADGKNWFEEQCTVSEPSEKLTYELTACSFPVHCLNHTYSFEKVGDSIRVKQVMRYEMKYGLFGRIMDALIVKSKSDQGIKKFLTGLKTHTENRK